jgi:hypothetical protein
VPQVVFFLGADGTIGQTDMMAATHQAAHRMVRVDPCVHPRRRTQLGTGRTQFDGVDGGGPGEGLDEGRQDN